MEVSESLARKRVVWKTKNVKQLLIRSVAAGFGVGYLPLAPGTWASLAGVLFLIVIYEFSGVYQLPVHVTLTVVLFPVAWFTSGSVSREDQDKDPRFVVIDEVFGQFLCFLWVPVLSFFWIFGFALFRFFDIVKPFPAKQCERLPGGLGIVMDDLVAGLYAGLILWLAYAI
jgi:phosphatidylglycerophosphatase A